MKSKQVTVYEGELLGPIDWSYNFFKDSCMSNERIERQIEKLVRVALNPEKWEVTTYGGWPRCGWGEVLYIGMYDGWPAWRPTPTIGRHERVLGGVAWEPWYSITDIRERS